MNIKESKEILKKVGGDAKIPVMLRGRHGIGKSEVIYQFAEEMGLPVVERRVAQMSEGDILGLPKQADNGTTEFLPPKWFKRAMDEPVVLFFDEIGRGTMQVSQSIFEISGSRKVAGNHLHEDTIVVAADNWGNEYHVQTLDPAGLDRWVVVDFDPTIQEWLNWADGKVAPKVIDFIMAQNTVLDSQENAEPGKVTPSRRSWVRLSNALGGPDGIDPSMGIGEIVDIAHVFVGEEISIRFGQFIEDRMIDPVEILNDDEKMDELLEKEPEYHIDFVEAIRGSRYRNRRNDSGEAETVDFEISDAEGKNLFRFLENVSEEIRNNLAFAINFDLRYAINDYAENEAGLETQTYIGDIMYEVKHAEIESE